MVCYPEFFICSYQNVAAIAFKTGSFKTVSKSKGAFTYEVVLGFFQIFFNKPKIKDAFTELFS